MHLLTPSDSLRLVIKAFGIGYVHLHRHSFKLKFAKPQAWNSDLTMIGLNYSTDTTSTMLGLKLWAWQSVVFTTSRITHPHST